jgi:hypothetical protein
MRTEIVGVEVQEVAAICFRRSDISNPIFF